MAELRVLMIGDVVGKGGRRAVQALLPSLRDELKLDGVFLNAENIAHGRGLNEESIQEMLDAGVDFCTTGNHVYDNPRGVEYMKRLDSKVLRPLNLPDDSPGKDHAIIELGTKKVLLVNLLGEVFMKDELGATNPFHSIDALLQQFDLEEFAAVLVDVHAEATSEKQGLAFYLDGRASAVVGTHTHTPTADLRTLPQGTGLVCDLGYVGHQYSVLGFNPKQAVKRFTTEEGSPLDPVESGAMLFNSVLVTIDPATRTTVALERIDRKIEV